MLYVYIFPICLCQRAGQYNSIMTGPSQYNVFFRILSELVFGLRYTITKNMPSDRFASMSPTKQYMDRSEGPYNILWVSSWSINCHMALSAMNYLLNNVINTLDNTDQEIKTKRNKRRQYFKSYTNLPVRFNQQRFFTNIGSSY